MQCLIAIVQAEDADVLVSKLVEQGFPVTRINSVGSFLARGNATILMGLQENQVEQVLGIMKKTCRTRTSYINATPSWEAAGAAVTPPWPLEVVIGGAVVFGLPVRRFVRLMGGAVRPAVDEQYPAPSDRASTAEEGGMPMNLVLAILQSDDADQVAGGLLAAGYRVTRLNTAGGFFRRGNVTLLIGVEGERVDGVLDIIRANCRLRTEAPPTDARMPAFGATIFVLEADRFVHL